jgi:hypothetical protein
VAHRIGTMPALYQTIIESKEKFLKNDIYIIERERESIEKRIGAKINQTIDFYTSRPRGKKKRRKRNKTWVGVYVQACGPACFWMKRFAHPSIEQKMIVICAQERTGWIQRLLKELFPLPYK